jgi:hypothetical protein
MSFHDAESMYPSATPLRIRRRTTSSAVNAVMATIALSISASLVLSACSGGHKSASPSTSAVASPASSPPAAVSSPAASSAAPVVSGSAIASPVASEPVSSLPPGVLVATIEAPATLTGFKIRLHRSSIIQVDAPQAAKGMPVTFAVTPTASTTLTPVSGHDGFFTGTADGVATVTVSQGGKSLGTIAITVWG